MSGFLKIVFFIGDLLLLNLSIFFSSWITTGYFGIGPGSGGVYLIAFSNLSWLFLVMVSAPYNLTKAWTLSKIIRSQLAFVFIHLFVLVSLVVFFKQHYSILQISIIYLTFIPSYFVYRIIVFYLRKVLTDEVPVKRYVLIGKNDLAKEVQNYFVNNPHAGYQFQGYLELDEGNMTVADIRQFCLDRDVHEIFCCTPNLSAEKLQQLINFGLDSLIKVTVISNTQNSHRQSLRLEDYDTMPGIDISTIPLDESRHQFVKRVFDIIFSLLFTVLVLSWLIPIIGLLIKLDSKGPVFFVQLRSGKNNQPFKCLKFRTMIVNTDSDSLQATKGDSRITKLGHFLRRTSIDELPQFLNVLEGSMSIIGPRPHMLKHTEEYSKLIDKFMGRHYVKPGITGLAQCLGYRGETRDLVDMQNRVRMDRYYIENWTFWFDIKIIFLTVVSLIRGSDKAF